MQPHRAFSRLPLRFDVARLEHEVAQFQARDWMPHEGEAVGQTAIPLVSVGGTSNADFALSGPVQPTHFLAQSPYLQQVLQAFATPISRSRLLRLPGNTTTPMHAESNYHWFRRMPIYVPMVTDRAVTFFCQGQGISMAAGEAWRVDHAQPHWMSNETERGCIHLMVETKIALPFQRLLVCSEPSDAADDHADDTQSRSVPYVSDQQCPVPVDPYCFEVLTPQEIGALTAEILAVAERAQVPQQAFVELGQQIDAFREHWTRTFAHYGHQRAGELAYQDLITDFQAHIATLAREWLRQSVQGMQAVEVIRSMLWRSRPAPRRLDRRLLAKRKRSATPIPADFQCPVFDRPLFIVSAPRAGSTLLFETLAQFPDVWTIGEESHETIEGMPELHPAARQYHSNRLTASEALPRIAVTLRERFARQLQDRAGRTYLDLPIQQRSTQVQFVEKTPKNALRIPFLTAVFPDARFIYLYRDPAENISSMLEGWRSRRFIAYQHLPGWPFRDWSFLLVPGWSSLQNCSLVDIVAYQWQVTNTFILDDLQALPAASWYLVRYADLVREPKTIIRDLSRFAGLHWDTHLEQVVSQSLPMSPMTLSTPSPDKWRKHAWEIAPVLPTVEPIVSRVAQWITGKNERSS